MARGEPRLHCVERTESGSFAVVFRIGLGDGSEIKILLPSGVAEDDVLPFARHRFHLLMAEAAQQSQQWFLEKDRLRAVDPAQRQPTGLEAKYRRE